MIMSYPQSQRLFTLGLTFGTKITKEKHFGKMVLRETPDPTVIFSHSLCSCCSYFYFCFFFSLPVPLPPPLRHNHPLHRSPHHRNLHNRNLHNHNLYYDTGTTSCPPNFGLNSSFTNITCREIKTNQLHASCG